jgi:F0F1-type ATP synthase epsilon subunit
MAETFLLQLVTLTRIAYQGDVEAVITWNPMAIRRARGAHQLHHVAGSGVFEIALPSGLTRHYFVSGRLSEVNGKMTILADSAEEPTAINVSTESSYARPKVRSPRSACKLKSSRRSNAT